MSKDMDAAAHTAYIALGGNLGDAAATVRRAFAALAALPQTRLLAASSLYRSAPVDASGPDFINAAASVATGLTPLQLLDALQAIETAEGRQRPARVQSVDEMSGLDALKVGLAQCVAMIPGVSRSGATIIGGMLLGLSRPAATEFSFFLAIPTLIGAGVYSLWSDRALLAWADAPLFAVGLALSFGSALACVRWLLRYIASHSFVLFAWYRIIFGLLILLTWQMNWVQWG